MNAASSGVADTTDDLHGSDPMLCARFGTQLGDALAVPDIVYRSLCDPAFDASADHFHDVRQAFAEQPDTGWAWIVLACWSTVSTEPRDAPSRIEALALALAYRDPLLEWMLSSQKRLSDVGRAQARALALEPPFARAATALHGAGDGAINLENAGNQDGG